MGMLKESKDGKFSSKRVTGFILILILTTIFVVKELNETLITNKDVFNNMLMFGAILIGLDVTKYFANIISKGKNN
jgi:hypothetical protein